jgi:hypothetical protein
MEKAVTSVQISDHDYDNLESDCCSQFKAGESMADGVSGKKKIDTTFENTSEDIVDRPRSDWDDDVSLRGMSVKSSTVRNPAPVPMDLWKFPHRRA